MSYCKMIEKMKYKYIFAENSALDPKLVYGRFYKLGNLDVKQLNDNGPLYIYNTTDDKSYYFAEVDDTILFKDILSYGKKFYLIFENDISNIYSNGQWNRMPISIITDKDILDKRNQVEPLIRQFVNEYNIPIYPTEQNSCEKDNSISFFNIIHTTLLIYIIHIIYSNLHDGISKYKYAYNALGITNNYSNEKILKELVEFYNKATNSYLKLGIYRTMIVEQKNHDNNIFIPMRYATNLFTFTWDTLQNYFCTNIVYEMDESNEKKYYVIYRRCPDCFATFSKEKEVDISFNQTPSMRLKYCDKCSKRHRNQKYETEITDKYNFIKNSINDIDTSTDDGKKLYNTIINIPAKSKCKNLKYLKKLEQQVIKHKKR